MRTQGPRGWRIAARASSEATTSSAPRDATTSNAPRWPKVAIRMLAAFCVLASGGGLLAATSTGATRPLAAPASSSSGLAQARQILAEYSKPPSKIAQTVPLPKAPPTGKTLIYLVETGVEGSVRVGEGEQAAAAALGWHFREVTFNSADPATLQTAFDTALQFKPTVVSVTASSESTWGTSTIAKYKKAGVPIIVDALGPYQSTPLILGDSGGAASYALAAKLVAAWFVANSDGKGKAVVTSIPGFTVLLAWNQAFSRDVASLCPGCSITPVTESVADAVNGDTSQLVVSALRRNPQDTYAIFDDGNFATGITSALNTAGLSKIKVAGSDGLAEQFDALRAGTEEAWTGQNQLMFGYGTVDYAARWVEGVKQTTNNDAVPTELITHSNVGKGDFFTAPTNGLQQYEHLWHVRTT
jgi:ribose transport system substrate-binding protein